MNQNSLLIGYPSNLFFCEETLVNLEVDLTKLNYLKTVEVEIPPKITNYKKPTVE